MNKLRLFFVGMWVISCAIIYSPIILVLLIIKLGINYERELKAEKGAGK